MEKVAKGNDYLSMMRMLEQVICVIIKSSSNEEMKQELIEKIMSLEDAT